MRKHFFLFMVIASVGMTGCGTVQYRNINPERSNQASFNQDASYCQAVAVGAVAMPNTPQYQNNVPMYAPRSGTMRDQYGNTYRYQENYNFGAAAQSSMAMAQQNFANAAASFQNLAAQLEAQGARDAIFNHCLAQYGWRQISKQEAKILEQEDRLRQVIQDAEQGNAEAQFILAMMHYQGHGVPKDERKAVQWLQKSANQGNAVAQLELGRGYGNGDYGLAKNERKAMELIRKAAEQGQPIAQDVVGDAYNFGFGGVTKNEKRANEWYGKAAVGLRQMADQGNAEAQFRLANGYYLGVGVAKDEAQAMKLYKKAAAQGYQPAQAALKQIKREGRL